MNSFLDAEVPGVDLVLPERTYLAWRELGLEVEALMELLSHRARVVMNPGHWFGREGAGFAKLRLPAARFGTGLTGIAGALEK